MEKLTGFSEQLKSLHDHLCPRQVLGIRIGRLAGELLQLDLPQADKRLFIFVETDGCFADGVSVVTGCWLGKRTLYLMDYGKVAATFVDTKSGTAIRIWPHPEVRNSASKYAPDESSRWHMMLQAYQIMPANELLCWQAVELTVAISEIISKPGVRVICSRCGEEIINEREVVMDEQTFCRSCYQPSYYSIGAKR
ncbi:MAG: TraR/DksA C4-type zinc finger protein [Anaerolineae bacterium]|nr:TraR/DksA C4-type zinc finger protein [Anaerolineae bacterium]